jgi:hypothetical protein
VVVSGVGPVRRQQLFTDVSTGRCLTVVDDPVDVAPRGTVVVAHALTGDRSGPGGLLAFLAAALCESCQVRVVRFDTRGSGDSTGAFHDARLADMTEDFLAVVGAHALFERPLFCAGFGIGGVPATLAANELVSGGDPRPRAVLLLSSALLEGVRFDVGAVEPMRGGEFHLPEPFFRECEALRPRSVLLASGLPFLLVYGAKDVELAARASWFAQRGTTVAIDSGHDFETPDARADLVRACATYVTKLLERRS